MKIYDLQLQSDQYIPCPHCKHTLWDIIRWQSDQLNARGKWDNTITVTCVQCGKPVNLFVTWTIYTVEAQT